MLGLEEGCLRSHLFVVIYGQELLSVLKQACLCMSVLRSISAGRPGPSEECSIHGTQTVCWAWLESTKMIFTNACSLYLRDHSCRVHFNFITEGIGMVIGRNSVAVSEFFKVCFGAFLVTLMLFHQ